MALPFNRYATLALCGVFSAICVHAQLPDSLDILTSKNWRTKGAWFGAATVTLEPIALLSTAGLNPNETVLALEQDYGERIAFDRSGAVNYSDPMDCPVGETLRDLLTFRMARGLVHFEYKLKPWAGNWTLYSSTYAIAQWSASGITLTRAISIDGR